MRVPAGEQVVAWVVTGGWNEGWEGTITVQMAGPAGWVSEPASYDWSSSYDWIGAGFGQCSAG